MNIPDKKNRIIKFKSDTNNDNKEIGMHSNKLQNLDNKTAKNIEKMLLSLNKKHDLNYNYNIGMTSNNVEFVSDVVYNHKKAAINDNLQGGYNKMATSSNDSFKFFR